LRRPRWCAQRNRAPAGALEIHPTIHRLDFSMQLCKTPEKTLPEEFCLTPEIEMKKQKMRRGVSLHFSISAL
jgi:hypothetical protein